MIASSGDNADQTFSLHKQASGNWAIFSEACINQGISTGISKLLKCEHGQDIVFSPGAEEPYATWTLSGDKIKSVECEGMVMVVEPLLRSNGGAYIVLAHENDWENQSWSIKSHKTKLLTYTGAPEQEWQAVFPQPNNYDMALQYGFPGAVDPDGCLESTHDKDLAKSAMHVCDSSQSLLIGETTSVGTLRAVASLVNEKGPDYMPGECCMDVPTNSDFFGYRVS